MRRIFVSLVFLLVFCALPMQARSIRVISLNIDSASVTVIDPQTNTVVHTITGIPWPRGSAFSPDGKTLYVCSEEQHAVNVVDMSTYQITNKIKLSGHPSGSLVITGDGKYLLVPMNPFYGLALEHHDSPDSGGVDVVDLEAAKVIKVIPVKTAVHDLFSTPGGKFAIGGDANTSFIYIIDLHTFDIVRKISLDNTPLTMIVDRAHDGSPGRIFAETKGLNGFEVIDFKTGKTLQTVEFPDSVKYGFSNLKNTLGGTTVKPPEYNPSHGTQITPDGKELWITSRGTNYVYVYSLRDLKMIDHIFLPSHKIPSQEKLETGDPHWLVITPDGKTVYIGLAKFKEVVAIDVKTLKEVASIPVGAGAKQLDVHYVP